MEELVCEVSRLGDLKQAISVYDDDVPIVPIRLVHEYYHDGTKGIMMFFAIKEPAGTASPSADH